MTNIKLIEKDTVLPKIKPYDWDVVINGRPYYVTRIEGFVHSIGGRHGDNDMWAYPRGEEPCYGNLIEYSCNTPVCWGIEYKPKKYSRCKWDEDEAFTGGKVTITRNGEDFYTLCGGMYYGIDKARVLIARLEEHPLNFCEIDYDKKMIRRKVWYRSQPMIITRYIKGQACVILEPDGCELKTPAEFMDDDIDYYADGDVKVEVFSEHIWWFRDYK